MIMKPKRIPDRTPLLTFPPGIFLKYFKARNTVRTRRRTKSVFPPHQITNPVRHAYPARPTGVTLPFVMTAYISAIVRRKLV